ncbi:hypothetical protein [Vibrio diabolicus]|uniref:hypothetical protein n=1 Tax=Vibrio diabolicus TaxID=50719 RepID=UPI0021513F5C|nr:hypothetical protein [Vibrio diabolicus]MCE9832732.1 hypothetical protein [Vibrio diabolicus]
MTEKSSRTEQIKWIIEQIKTEQELVRNGAISMVNYLKFINIIDNTLKSFGDDEFGTLAILRHQVSKKL